MKDFKLNLTLILIVIIILMGIYSVNITSRLSFAEKQYDSLIENTNKLVENLTTKFKSLEENSTIKQMLVQLDTLTQENKALKILLAQKEGSNCDTTIEKTATQKSKKILKQGNRGFVIKNGEITQK